MGTTPLTTGFTAVWSADATYQFGMTVIHSSAIWEAAANNVRSEPSDINTDWTKVLDGGGGGGVGPGTVGTIAQFTGANAVGDATGVDYSDDPAGLRLDAIVAPSGTLTVVAGNVTGFSVNGGLSSDGGAITTDGSGALTAVSVAATINATGGFTGTVTPVTSITIVNGIVTAAS